jgi:hypothetical protein
VAAAGETTGSSRMEQSVDVGGALLQFVLSDSVIDVRRRARFEQESRGRPTRVRGFPEVARTRLSDQEAPPETKPCKEWKCR